MTPQKWGHHPKSWGHDPILRGSRRLQVALLGLSCFAYLSFGRYLLGLQTVLLFLFFLFGADWCVLVSLRWVVWLVGVVWFCLGGWFVGSVVVFVGPAFRFCSCLLFVWVIWSFGRSCFFGLRGWQQAAPFSVC